MSMRVNHCKVQLASANFHFLSPVLISSPRLIGHLLVLLVSYWLNPASCNPHFVSCFWSIPSAQPPSFILRLVHTGKTEASDCWSREVTPFQSLRPFLLQLLCCCLTLNSHPEHKTDTLKQAQVLLVILSAQ